MLFVPRQTATQVPPAGSAEKHRHVGPGAALTRVLMVEDDRAYADVAGQVLASTPGLQWLGCLFDAAEAISLLPGLSPDILLVDLCIGGDPIGGIRLIHRSRVVKPECQCLVVTALALRDGIVGAFQAGAVGYVLKDAGVRQLREHVRIVSQGGSPLSPRVARMLLDAMSESLWNVALSEQGASTPLPPEADNPLSEHEQMTLELAAKGFTHDEIAVHMGVSRNTVLTYAKRCYRKLQVHSRAEAIYEARNLGLLKG